LAISERFPGERSQQITHDKHKGPAVECCMISGQYQRGPIPVVQYCCAHQHVALREFGPKFSRAAFKSRSSGIERDNFQRKSDISCQFKVRSVARILANARGKYRVVKPLLEALSLRFLEHKMGRVFRSLAFGYGKP
jgi:hypothetical protein